MKKVVLVLILGLSMMGMLIGCGKEKDGDDGNDEQIPTPVVTNDQDEVEDEEDKGLENVEEDINTFVPLVNQVVKEDYDYNDYIKLGKYKGVEVKVNQLEVLEGDIDTIIQMDLADNGAEPIEVTDRDVKRGDLVNIDFIGYHNEEPFEGGAAEGFGLTIGSNRFIGGFEEQLIGAQIGKEVNVNVVFPENYDNTDLSGEPAVFKVKINSIQCFELTDDFIKDIVGFDTEDSYRDSIRQELSFENADRKIRQKENDIYNAVITGSEITLPDNLLEYYEEDIRTRYGNIAGSYGTDLETLLSLSGSSIEAFEKDAKVYSKDMATRELIVQAISNAEGIELSEEEFQTGVTQYAMEYGYESNEAFLEEVETEVLKADLLFYKIMDFLVNEAIEL